MTSKIATVSMVALMTMGALALVAAPASAIQCNHLPDVPRTVECASDLDNTWVTCTDGTHKTLGYIVENQDVDCFLP